MIDVSGTLERARVPGVPQMPDPRKCGAKVDHPTSFRGIGQRAPAPGVPRCRTRGSAE